MKDSIDFHNAFDSKGFICGVKIDGRIDDSRDYSNTFASIVKNKNCAGLIVNINSPGGSFVDSEDIYNDIRKISKHGMPVVAVMGSIAASGGYMVSLAADHIIASAGSITGSIGVIMQSFQVVEAMNKIGIKAMALKSSDLKANPSPFEESNDGALRAVQSSIDNTNDIFLNMVSKRRDMSMVRARQVGDGRIYNGKQALEVGLIDELGGKDEALEWLYSKGIERDASVIYLDSHVREGYISRWLSSICNDMLKFFDTHINSLYFKA